ncbi:MAG: VTT domain-containing protein [archaeon]|nr:VTT domain-containing protein [archaeon]
MMATKTFESRKAYALVAGAFLVSAGYVGVLFWRFPEMSAEDRSLLEWGRLRGLPSLLDVTKEVSGVLAKYTDEHYAAVLQALVSLYVVLQAFSIPGTIFLTVALGSLFGLAVGFAASMAGSLLGASLSFWLSLLLGRGLIHRLFPSMAAEFGRRIEQQRAHLLNYLLFLRATPIVPNWFINIASPLFGVPYSSFAIATAVGIVPAVFTFVQAGVTLHELTSSADLSRTWQSLALMFALGFLCLLPTFKPVQQLLDRFFASFRSSSSSQHSSSSISTTS